MRKITLLLCLLMLSGCSWMKFWEDDEEGKSKEPAKLVKFDEEIRIRKLWSRGVGAGQNPFLARLHPAVDADTVYSADNEGLVVAVDRDSGRKRWETELDVPLSGGVGLGGGLVLVGSLEGDVFALEANGGAERWRVSVHSEILSAPGANSDIVVVQGQDGKLNALDSDTGEKLWQFDVDVPVLTLRGTGAPLVTDSMVISGFANGKLVALSAGTGALLWESRVAVPKGRTELERMVDLDGQPLLNGDVVYAASYQGRLGALSRGSGRPLWYQDASTARTPAFGLEQVYITNDEDAVKALRANSGQVLWTNDSLSYRKVTGPVVAGGYVAVGDGEGYLHVLSQSDGRFVGRVKVDGSGISVPIASDGDTLYVLDNDGDLTAYRFESR